MRIEVPLEAATGPALRQTGRSCAVTPSLVTVGALSARGRFIPTVTTSRFWFAKLYAITTYFEIGAVRQGKFKHPGFTLTFIPIFFDMYASAIRAGGANNGTAPPLWRKHFQVCDATDPNDFMGITKCIASGAIGHIQGDMYLALAKAYSRYKRKEKPEFNEMKEDFMGPASRTLFARVQASFFLELSKRSLPVSPELGQYILGVGSQLEADAPSMGLIWNWRQEAWKKADTEIKQRQRIEKVMEDAIIIDRPYGRVV